MLKAAVSNHVVFICGSIQLHLKQTLINLLLVSLNVGVLKV